MGNDTSEIQSKGRNVKSDEIPRHWYWVMLLGIVLVVLGVVGVALSLTSNPQSLLLVGWFLLASGLLQGFHTFSRHLHQAFSIDIVDSTVYTVTGLLIVSDPIAGTLELTLLVSGMLMTKGVVRIVLSSGGAIVDRLPLVSSGVVGLALGMILWLSWPSAGLLILGSFIAVEIGVTGWSLILRGSSEKKLVKRAGLQVV